MENKKMTEEACMNHPAHEEDLMEEEMKEREQIIRMKMVTDVIPSEVLTVILVAMWYVYCYWYNFIPYFKYEIPAIYFEMNLNKLLEPTLLFFIYIACTVVFLLYSIFRKGIILFLCITPTILLLWIYIQSMQTDASFFLLLKNLYLECYHILSENFDIFILMILALCTTILIRYMVRNMDKLHFKELYSLFALFASIMFISILIIGLLAQFFVANKKYLILMENNVPSDQVVLDTYKDYYVTGKYRNLSHDGEEKILTGEWELFRIDPPEKTHPIREINSSEGKIYEFEQENISLKKERFRLYSPLK
jgi:hypothetical protein